MLVLTLALALSLQDAGGLIETLGSEDLAKRDDARAKLKAMGEKALPDLDRAAESGDKDLAARAKRLVREIGVRARLPAAVLKARPAFDEEMADLEEFSWTDVLTHVVELEPYLAGRGLQYAAADLERLVKDSIPELKYSWQAAEVVRRWKMQGIATELLQISVSKRADDEEKVWAAYAMASCGKADGFDKLAKHATSGDAREQARAIRALVRLGRTEHAARLRELAKSDSAWVQACLGMAEAGDAAAAPILRAHLADDGEGPNASLLMLARLADGDARGACRAILDKTEYDGIRVPLAARVLGRIGAAEDVGRLARLLESQDYNIQTASVTSLGRLRAMVKPDDLTKLLRDERAHVRDAGVRAISAVGAKESAAAVSALLEDPRAGTRRDAVIALVALGGTAYLDHLARRLKDADSEVRGVAATGLWRLDGRDTKGVLIELLVSPEAGARVWAAADLGTMGAKDAVGSIRKCLKDDDLDVRYATAYALALLGAADGVDEIVARAEEDRSTVPLGALNALRSPQALAALLRPIANDVEGTREEALARLAKEAGWTLDRPECWDYPDAVWAWTDVCLRAAGKWTLLEALEDVVGSDHAFVLDDGRLRILSRSDALKFWQGWRDGRK